MRSALYCRHCGEIIIASGNPYKIPCAICGANRLFRLKLPEIVKYRLVKKAAQNCNSEAAQT